MDTYTYYLWLLAQVTGTPMMPGEHVPGTNPLDVMTGDFHG